MALLFQLPSPSCQEENLDVLSVLTLQLGPGDVLATAGRKRLPRITHLVLHLLSLLLFQAETHGGIFTSTVYLHYTKCISIALGGEPRSFKVRLAVYTDSGHGSVRRTWCAPCCSGGVSVVAQGLVD